VSRYVFQVPTSEQCHWLRWVQEQRLLYRLALGQPNQEDFIEVLTAKGVAESEVRTAMINLSPWFNRFQGNEVTPLDHDTEWLVAVATK
jgi:hypothetical protein